MKSIFALTLVLFASIASMAADVVRPIPGRPIPNPSPAQPSAGTISFQYSDNLGSENLSYGVSTYRPGGKLKTTLKIEGSDGNIIFQPVDNGKEETIEAKRWSGVSVTLENPTNDPEAATWLSQFNSCISNLAKGPEIRDAYKKRSASYTISIRLSGAAYADMVKKLKAEIAGGGYGINAGLYTSQIDSFSCSTFSMMQSFR